jgi:PAS domain S-box-containing protein
MGGRGRRISAAIVESSQDAIIGHTTDGIVISWNSGAERVFGYNEREIVGQALSKLTPPRDGEELGRVLDRVRLGSVPPNQLEIGAITRDGCHIEVSISVSPVLDRHGKIIAASTIARECTERRLAENHRKLLVNELDHRIKNILMVVNAMVVQTARTARSTQEFAHAIEQRIQALSRIHSVPTDDATDEVELQQIVQGELTPYASEARRLCIAGPRVGLTARAAQTLGLALHELATNAVKYGALSVVSGEVAVRWSVNGLSPAQTELSLRWSEKGGPPVVIPTRRGFGTQLLDRVVGSELGAVVDRQFHRRGVRCHIAFPLLPRIGRVLERDRRRRRRRLRS